METLAKGQAAARGASVWYAAVSRRPDATDVNAQRRSILIGLAVILIALNLYAPAEPTILERLLASVLIVIAIVPVWRWLSGADNGTPLLAFITLLYGLYYSVPIFLLSRYSLAWYTPQTIPEVDIEWALSLSCLGLLALEMGYYAGIAKDISRRLPRFALCWTRPPVVRDLGFLFAFGGLAVRAVFFPYIAYSNNTTNAVTPILQQLFYYLTDLPFVGLTILCCLDLTNAFGARSRFLFRFIVVPTLVLLGLATGTIAQGLRVGMLLVFVYALLRRRIPWKILALALASIVVLQPAKTVFRNITGSEMDAAAVTPVRRIELFAEVVRDLLFGRIDLGTDFVTVADDRLNQITILANVVEDTPGFIPTWGGDTYYPLLTKFVPRIVDPDKRPDDASQAFPHRYGFLANRDVTTSFKLAQLVEGYVNFGSIGVIVVMFIIGGLYKVGQDLFVHPAMGFGAVVAESYIFTQWFDIEANASLMFGGFLYQLAYIGIISTLVRLVEGISGGSSEVVIVQIKEF